MICYASFSSSTIKESISKVNPQFWFENDSDLEAIFILRGDPWS